MPRSLTLSLDGREFPVNLIKVDREKLYGAVEIEAFDEKGKPATIKVLAPDGRTLIDRGGTALATVDEEGTSVDRGTLRAVDANGELVEPVQSSFNQANVLKEANAEDYLSQVVKSVYALEGVEGESIDYLQDHLNAGNLYTFPFSYRGGLEYDSAFVVGNGKDAFLIVGKQASLEYVRLNQAATLDSIEEEEISGDDIDFALL